MNFAKKSSTYITNTKYGHRENETITFKYLSTPGFTEPWTKERFAQIDYILIGERWKNSVLDSKSMPKIAMDTDHLMVMAQVKIKFKQNARKEIAENHLNSENLHIKKDKSSIRK